MDKRYERMGESERERERERERESCSSDVVDGLTVICVSQSVSQSVRQTLLLEVCGRSEKKREKESGWREGKMFVQDHPVKLTSCTFLKEFHLRFSTVEQE